MPGISVNSGSAAASGMISTGSSGRRYARAMVVRQTVFSRGTSSMSNPRIDFIHCLSPSIRDRDAAGTPRTRRAMLVTWSNRPSGGVSSIPSRSTSRTRSASTGAGTLHG